MSGVNPTRLRPSVLGDQSPQLLPCQPPHQLGPTLPPTSAKERKDAKACWTFAELQKAPGFAYLGQEMICFILVRKCFNILVRKCCLHVGISYDKKQDTLPIFIVMTNNCVRKCQVHW